MSQGLERRTFIVSSLAAGFALAAAPSAHADVIHTDSEGLVAGEIRIDGMPAYRAMPAGPGKFGLVLVVQEIFGVHEHIRDVCRRFAKAGYMAIAPELYARQGDVSKIADVNDIMKIVARVPDEEVMRDLDATAFWAKRSGKLDGDRVAITGFCWGGRIVWLYSATSSAPKAAVAWYGRLSNATNTRQTRTALDVASKLKTPVLGLYGGKDAGIPVAHVEMMRRELEKAKQPSELVVYPDAPHGFHADYRPSFVKADAEDGWKRALSWFKEHGV